MFRNSDLDAVARYMADPETMRFIGGVCDRVKAWERLAICIGHWVLRGYGIWALEEKATGLLVGQAGLWYPENKSGPEVTWLVARERWKRGYATEAARAVVKFAFDELGLNQVVGVIHPQNGRSIHVAERVGGRFRGEIVDSGETFMFFVVDRPGPER